MTSDGRILLYFSVYIVYNHDYNLIFFTPCHSFFNWRSPFNRLFSKWNESLSRIHSWNACRFFFLNSLANRRSRVFTVHIVIILPIRFRLPKLIIIRFAKSWRVCPTNAQTKKEGERPGFDPSTLGAVGWRISPLDHYAPPLHYNSYLHNKCFIIVFSLLKVGYADTLRLVWLNYLPSQLLKLGVVRRQHCNFLLSWKWWTTLVYLSCRRNGTN